MPNLVIEFSRKLERHPIRAILLLIATSIGYMVFTVNVLAKWPDIANVLAFFMGWIWLFWAIYLGVPIIRSLGKKFIGK